jgi:hypothetical protein
MWCLSGIDGLLPTDMNQAARGPGSNMLDRCMFGYMVQNSNLALSCFVGKFHLDRWDWLG